MRKYYCYSCNTFYTEDKFNYLSTTPLSYKFNYSKVQHITEHSYEESIRITRRCIPRAICRDCENNGKTLDRIKRDLRSSDMADQLTIKLFK